MSILPDRVATGRRGDSPAHDGADAGAPLLAFLDGRELTAIFLGGAAGALLRAWLVVEFAGGANSWPWVTFSVNVTGCFVLALIATHLQERLPESPHWHPLLGTGFCGAYTTFSTMQLEALRMLEGDRVGLALGYALASVSAGYLAIAAGAALLRKLHGESA